MTCRRGGPSRRERRFARYSTLTQSESLVDRPREHNDPRLDEAGAAQLDEQVVAARVHVRNQAELPDLGPGDRLRVPDGSLHVIQVELFAESLADPRLAGPYHFLLGRSYLFLGNQRQAASHLEMGLAEAARCEDDATRGRIHYVLAQHGAMSGRPREGLEHGRQAVVILERAGEPWWTGPAHWAVGLNHTLLGEYDAALAAQAQAAARGTAVGDPQIMSSAAWASGLVHICRGDLDAGIRSCEDALARSPDPLNTALALGWLGFARLEGGELAPAVARLEEALRLLDQFRFRQPQAWFLTFLAEAHRRAHRLEMALDLASRGLDHARATGSIQGIGWAERTLGHVAQARGALGDAHDHLREALRAFERVEAAFEIARTRLDLAGLAHAWGDAGGTATHLAEAERGFRAVGVLRWVERAEKRARAWRATP